MTTSTAVAPTAGRVTVHPATFGRLVAAEWVKLRSLRSTWWILGLGTVFLPALGVSRVASIAGIPEAYGADSVVGSVYVTSGVGLTQLAFCTLGVLVVSGEYGTGQIRSTFLASPGRLSALAAKLVVTIAAVVAASLVGVAIAWAGSVSFFDKAGMSVDLMHAEDARILLGVPLYLATAVALAFGIGTLVRSSAAGVATVLGILLVLENGLASIPWAPVQTLAAHLPASAGSRLLAADGLGSGVTASDTATLTPWEGYGVMVAWTVGILVTAAVLVRRRDA